MLQNQKEKYPLSKIILIYTGETSTYAYDIKAEYDLKRKSDPSIPEVELYETYVKDIAERYDLFEYFKNEKMDTENISKSLLEIAERVDGRNIPTKDTCYKIINKYSKRKNIK